MDAAGDIISLYDPLVRVMREVSVYMKSMLTLLKSPYIFNLDLNFNRLILFAWMDCFAAYVKVMFFLEKFPEAMPMILLFFAAKSVAGSLKQANASAQEFHWLKKATANIRRHLIDEFTPLQCSLLHIINEIKDIVCFSYDIHGLRELFDPSNTDIELSGYHVRYYFFEIVYFKNKINLVLFQLEVVFSYILSKLLLVLDNSFIALSVFF